MRKPRLHKRVTIKDVALKAGVSIGAVSRVLHGRASTIRVSEPTAEIIRQAALELDYKRNRTSSSLRAGRTRSLLIAAPFEVSLASSPYYATLVDSIIAHAGEKGYTVCLSKGAMTQSLKFEDSKGKFDGIIWLGAPKHLEEEEQGRLHGELQVGINLVDSDVPETILNVKTDEIQAILNYVGHLRVNDITKIGLFAGEGDNQALMSESALKDLCKRLAIQFFSYKSIDDVPSQVQSSDVEAAIVWQMVDAATAKDLSSAKGSRKVQISAIVTDAEMKGSKGLGKHFALPLNEMSRAAVELLISRIENPQAVSNGVALSIPIPA